MRIARGIVGLRPASWSSSLRLFSSASAHDRVPALRLNCLPPCDHRKCLRQVQPLWNSSPTHLQPGVWRTKMVIVGLCARLAQI